MKLREGCGYIHRLGFPNYQQYLKTEKLFSVKRRQNEVKIKAFFLYSVWVSEGGRGKSNSFWGLHKLIKA